jgi:hypothetical protein
MVVTVKITVLWVVTPRSSERARSFGETYRLCLRGRRVSQARNQQKQAASSVLGSSYFFRFLEDGRIRHSELSGYTCNARNRCP